MKRILSLILAIAIILPLIPIGEIKAYAADEIVITKIEVARTIEELGGQGKYTVIISGSELNKAQILYKSSASTEYIPMPSELPGSGNTLKQYKIDAGVTITHLRIDTKEFRILEDNMPEIKKVTKLIDGEERDTKQFDLNGEQEEEIIIRGENFEKVGTEEIEGIITKTTITIGNKTADSFFEYGSPVTLYREDLRSFGTGNKNILIERTSKDKGVDIQITYLQKDVIRIYESIDLDLNQDISIYPNMGKVGSDVEITIKNKDEKYSVFFKEKDEDLYQVKTMGEDHVYPLVTENKTVINLKVPKKLDTGKIYRLYITNNLQEHANKASDFDLTPFVTKEKYIGDFYVVDTTTGPFVEKVVPNSGSSDGSYIKIHGKRLEELEIPKLSFINKEINTNQLEVIKDTTNSPTKLRINYDIDSQTKYNDEIVTGITRDFLVTIGKNAIFEEDYLDDQKFQNGDSKEDILYLKTNVINQDDLINPVKDVVLLITTTIKTDDGEYSFTQLAIKEKGFTFLISSQDPEIEEVTPNQIQVKNISDPETKNDTIISIQGSKFNVFRYQEDNKTKTNYPKIAIGGINAENAQLTVERLSDGTVKYYKKNGDEFTISEDSKENIVFQVLDSNGNIVDGVGNNVEGASIVLTIPKDFAIEKDIIESPLPVGIANPKRDTPERRPYSSKSDMISFITTDQNPTIESVEPWRVTTQGGEEITITGNGFLDGIKVFIHGIEVKGVKRDIDKLTTKGKLTFKAPKGAEGITVLMVQNPSGGADTHSFVYVQTENIDPKLNKIIPDKGTEDDIIILRGDNFLKPDPTVKNLSGIGIDKLIGTVVKIGGIDVNEYNSSKSLEEYSAPSTIDQHLIQKQENTLLGTTSLKLTNGYKNSLIKSRSSIYTIRKNKEGTMDIAGYDDIYTFFLQGSDIKARDQSGIEYNATIDNDKIILASPASPTKEKVFDIDYNFDVFSIAEDEMGSKTLKLADYYKSIYLWDDLDGKYFIITRDANGKVVLTDGRNENYQVKIDGQDIYADNNKLTIAKDNILLGDRKLDFKTPYKVEADIITGHRIEILDTGEIEVRVPNKIIPKKYDVTVTNPDTKSSTIKSGFEYIGSSESPEIYYIDPPEGSIEGGYVITIGGSGFDKDTKVLIDGISGTNIVVDQVDYKTLKVKVPKYRGTEEDFISQKKFVRVHVITRTGQASTKEMFAYKLTSSKPSIKLLDTKGSVAGGNIIRLVGKDIRFYEPYTGTTSPTTSSIPGQDYEDLDGDKKWTNILSDKQAEAKPLPLVPPTPDYDKYLSSLVLPTIQFGSSYAKIVEFAKNGDEYLIQVVLPEGDSPGSVDVILSNNDRAQSNTVKFTYESSNPTIKPISPAVGSRMGGEKRDIQASGYIASEINIIDAMGRERQTSINLIRFGQQSNKDIDIDDYDAGGRIRNGNAEVNFKESGLKAELKDGKITLTLKTGDQAYTGTYPLSQGSKYINIASLKEIGNKSSFKGQELIRVTIKPEGKLEVERGFSPSVKETVKGILETEIPYHYKTGKVDVALLNKGGESNKVPFEYTNPSSKPTITDIIRDGQGAKVASGGKEKIQQIPAKGGMWITVKGTEFMDSPNPTITIGRNNEIVIPSSAVEFEDENTLKFRMPVSNDNLAGSLLPLFVENQDRGVGISTNNVPPIYVQIISGETDPSTGSIDPDRGPVSGGTKVTITGTDFREKVDGYSGEFKIFFGDVQVPKANIISFTHNQIVLTTPKGDKPGTVPVRIINPDETPTDNNIFFTYISEPKIYDVNPRSIFINDDKTEITITGQMFMEGARVTINDVDALEVKYIDDKTLKVKFPQVAKVEEVSIQVINPDGGESNKFTDFRYELPLPLKPMVLEAIPGYEGTVLLIWNKSDPDILNKSSSFEVYGRKTADAENIFIASTENHEHLLRGLEANTKYTFMVRALNEYGAAIDFATVEVTTLSAAEDHKQKEKEDKLKQAEKQLELKGKEVITGKKLVKTIGRENIVNGIGIVDLTLSKYKNIDEYTVKIPLAMAREDSTLIIKDSTMHLSINPKDLYTYKVSLLDTGDKDANLIMNIKRARETGIPRGMKTASQAYELDFAFQNSKQTIQIDQLLRSGKLSLNLDTLTYGNQKDINLYTFHTPTGEYKKSSTNTTTPIKQNSKHILLYKR